MSDKHKLIIGCFLILFTLIGAGGFAFDRLLKLAECDELERQITHLGNRKDDLVLNYVLLSEISKNETKLAAFRKYIETKEPLEKTLIERFAKKCKTGYQKAQLLMMLSNYDLYLRTKSLLFKESQAAEMLWLRGVTPVKDDLTL